MKISPSAERPATQGNTEYFAGDVAITPLISAPDPARLRGVSVTFQPGARTAWHTHPLGQTLIVIAGEGWAQTEGEARQTIRPGDVVWFAPGERHWHGATDDRAMTHIALQEALEGDVVTWQEHVAETQS